MSETTRPTATRRELLAGAAAGMLVPLLPGAALAAGNPATDPAVANFVALSEQLTGQPALSAELGGALLAAFRAQDAAFDTKTAALSTALANLDADAPFPKPADGQPDLGKLSESILKGWFLGVAGSGKSAVCVAYAGDLANAAVADVLSPPSYAYGACGSWAKPPV